MAVLDDETLVRSAMALAAEAGGRGDPPFGAILIDASGAIVGRASNHQVSSGDPAAHAEVELIRAVARAGHTPPLTGFTLASNAEPCSMCSSLLIKAGVSRIVFGAPHEAHMDPALPLADVVARAHRPPAVRGGVLAAEAAAQIARFRERQSAVD